jgi:hemolysin activation/secretion protein
VGSDGVKLGLGASAVQYQIDKGTVDNQDFNGSSSAVNVFGLYPLVRSRNFNLFVVGNADRKTFTDVELALEREKRVDSAAITLNGDFRDAVFSGGVNTFELTVANGRVTYPAGRPGALTDDPSFTRVGLNYTRLQNLVTGRLMLYTALRAQFAQNNLDSTEQFRLGGPDGLRAFASGEGTGDQGLLATVELRLLPPESWFGSISRELVLSAFYDQGTVKKRHRPPDDPTFVNTRNLAGAGIGVTWLRPGEWAARFSVAGRTRGTPEGDTQQKNPAVFLQVTYFFR